jgi:hypothetical protein
MTMGCASSPPMSTPPTLAANLRQPCPPLQTPGDGTKAAMLLWGRAVIKQYADCAERHDRTVQAWPQ